VLKFLEIFLWIFVAFLVVKEIMIPWWNHKNNYTKIVEQILKVERE
jgi:hypothetical protein